MKKLLVISIIIDAAVFFSGSPAHGRQKPVIYIQHSSPQSQNPILQVRGRKAAPYVFCVILDASPTTAERWSQLRTLAENVYKSCLPSDSFYLFTIAGRLVTLEFSCTKSCGEHELNQLRSILDDIRSDPVAHADFLWCLRRIAQFLKSVSPGPSLVIFILTPRLSYDEYRHIRSFASDVRQRGGWSILVNMAPKTRRELLSLTSKHYLFKGDLPPLRRAAKSFPSFAFSLAPLLSTRFILFFILPTTLVLLYAWCTTVTLRRRIYILLAPLLFFADDLLLITQYEGSFFSFLIIHLTLWVGFFLWTRAILRRIWRSRTNRRDATIKSNRPSQSQTAATALHFPTPVKILQLLILRNPRS